MGLFEGKTSTERNKMIAAAVLGVVALVALYLAFGRSFFGGTATTATVKSTPTPKPGGSPAVNVNVSVLPSADEQDFVYQTTPVVYIPGNAYAPDAGRNIFAFYEPPPPTPYVPTPEPPVIIKTPTPPPPPPILLSYANPQSVYAGSPGFRLEVSGDKFTPESRIYFNQNELPTVFVNAQKIVADIPANFIAQEGSRQIIVQTPDGKLYSNQAMLTVQAPPRPTFQYIGMIGRKRYNNDTAYFTEAGRPAPFPHRLNDVIGGRFRIVDISPTEVVVEDVNLGFRHPVPISKTAGSPGQPSRGQPNDGFVPFNPNTIPQGDIPGIPGNVQRYVPPQPPQPQSQQQRRREDRKDVDDDDPQI